ncbi:hypothetical protein [Streptomyces daghestanicus]|uniref:Uncharacterized protein n=1 Tax=Streptomyces daghestanicus TaxID=66885 RepID=A0ABQ3Q7K6_9ACTN|nr:hypothetical protein [Streptomyces daghestanicus]GGU62309.1 hypothetical protein GCM10010259_61160 [Streptomyces daghestanicus]GHI33271.1 hypothetical protein Sdagh_50010 [Streptomyces daghestanicus]
MVWSCPDGNKARDPELAIVLARFDDLLAAAAPELVGRVMAVGFDADTGRLDVAPDAPAYGTQLRWKAPKLIAAANEKVSGANVRTVHVLAPAPAQAGPATVVAAPPPQPAVPAVPPEGYRRAIEAHRQAARPSLADPAIAEAERLHPEPLDGPCADNYGVNLCSIR